jgi:hypothetical protein
MGKRQVAGSTTTATANSAVLVSFAVHMATQTEPTEHVVAQGHCCVDGRSGISRWNIGRMGKLLFSSEMSADGVYLVVQRKMTGMTGCSHLFFVTGGAGRLHVIRMGWLADQALVRQLLVFLFSAIATMATGAGKKMMLVVLYGLMTRQTAHRSYCRMCSIGQWRWHMLFIRSKNQGNGKI